MSFSDYFDTIIARYPGVCALRRSRLLHRFCKADFVFADIFAIEGIYVLVISELCLNCLVVNLSVFGLAYH